MRLYTFDASRSSISAACALEFWRLIVCHALCNAVLSLVSIRGWWPFRRLNPCADSGLSSGDKMAQVEAVAKRWLGFTS